VVGGEKWWADDEGSWLNLEIEKCEGGQRDCRIGGGEGGDLQQIRTGAEDRECLLFLVATNLEGSVGAQVYGGVSIWGENAKKTGVLNERHIAETSDARKRANFSRTKPRVALSYGGGGERNTGNHQIRKGHDLNSRSRSQKKGGDVTNP